MTTHNPALSAQLIASEQRPTVFHFPSASAIASQPELLTAAANAAQKAKRFDEIITLLEDVVILRPLPYFRNELIRFLMLTQRYKQALYHLRILYHQFYEKDVVFYINYLYALECTGEFQEALRVVDEANTRNPDNPVLLALRGSVMQTWGRYDAMLHDYRAASALVPGHDRITFTLGLHEMMVSDFAEGLDRYAVRQNGVAPALLSLSLPTWVPGGDPRQKILLLAEQGLGDTLMFLRLMPWLKQYAEVSGLVAPKKLMALLQRSYPGIAVYASEDAAQIPLGSYHAKLPLGDLLVHAKKAGFEHISGPSLKADEAKTAEMRARYTQLAAARGKKHIIGVAWNTINPFSAVYRNIAPTQLKALLSTPDVLWVDMQYGAHEDATAYFAKENLPVFHDSAVNSMAEPDVQAAQIMAVDGIVTIDNTLVHLAGGLGKKALLLVPTASDWRWGITGESNHWYPSVTLLRQESPISWKPTLESAAGRITAGWPA